MKHCLLIWTLAVTAAISLAAGDYADEVKDLGDKNKRSAASEALAKAGADAFTDLLDGLNENPEEEGVSADIKAERSARRLECARLLGGLNDTRASADLVRLLEAQAVENPAYPWLGAACANALGRLWAEKPAGTDRNAIVGSLKLYALDAKLDNRVRWGALHGLAHLKAEAASVSPMMTDAALELLLRSAAMEVVVACKHAPSADALLDIWETQRLGPKGEDGKRTGAVSKDYTKPLGMQALFGLASMGDKRAVDGLVDVTTLNEFAAYAQLRDEAVRQMKTEALLSESLAALVGTFKDVDKPTARGRAAQTLGDLGARGVTAFLAVADDEAPKPKEGEPADKYPADHYAKEVDAYLTSLRSDDALKAFVEAYGNLPAESKSLRQKIIDHLLNNRNALKEASLALFRTAADDESLEAPKRAQAINAWAEAKGKESFDDLVRWAKSADGVIRAQAVQNLGRSYIPLAKSLPLLKEALADKGADYAKARENAIQGLQRSDEKELLPLFIDSLDPEKETSAEVRNAALKSIDVYRRNAKASDEDVFGAVKGRVADPDENVRATAIRIASTMAQRMGNRTEGVEIIEKALGDSSKEVRLQAYGQVVLVAGEIKADKVISAALLEETPDLKGNAVQALSSLSAFGDNSEQQQRLVDLALGVVEDRVRENAAKDLLGKLGQGALFNYTSDKLRARIEALTSAERKEYVKVPVLVRTLIAIRDDTYFSNVQTLAEVPNVELRRACVEYVKEFGTKNDLPFLRTLKDRTDAAAEALRPDIEQAIATLEGR
ncbi:MAG: hypothetical protein H6840_04410 [Planctomycetes bacterium]|nr:hypothetical protein [Planctomycetota bacterium]